MHKLLEIYLSCQKTFFTLCLSNLNPEDEVSSPKIDGFMTDYISKLKRAWQAQFFSHDLVILKNCVFFKDKQMILAAFFDIFTGFRFPKNLKSLHIQFLSHPCVSLQIIPEQMRFHSSSRDGAVGYFPRKGASLPGRLL